MTRQAYDGGKSLAQHSVRGMQYGFTYGHQQSNVLKQHLRISGRPKIRVQRSSKVLRRPTDNSRGFQNTATIPQKEGASAKIHNTVEKPLSPALVSTVQMDVCRVAF